MNVRRLGPPLDLHSSQHTFLDQFGDQRLAWRIALPVVVGQVREGTYSVVPGCQLQQLLAGVTHGDFRSSQHFGGDDAFGQVVDAGEVARASSHGNAALPEEVFEGDLGIVPIPPGALLGGAFGKIARRDRAVNFDAVVHLFDVVRTPFVEGEVTRPLVLEAHLPTMELIVSHVDVRGLVNPILEQLAVFVASGIRLCGCGPSRANSGNSWLRTNTLTESIWISPMRSSTRRKWRRSTHPSGGDRQTPARPTRSGARPQRELLGDHLSSVGDGDGDRVDDDIGPVDRRDRSRHAAWRRQLETLHDLPEVVVLRRQTEHRWDH